MDTESPIALHPLQRMRSPSRTFSAAFHSLGLVLFAKSYLWLAENNSIVRDSFGWHFQYLTIIGLTLACATFTVGLLADVSLSSRLFAVKNVLSVASAPMEVVISLLYWSIKTINPALVMPDWIVLDIWSDLGFHLFPAALLLIDLFFLSPPWTVQTRTACTTASSIAIMYYFWVELCHSRNNWYAYPLLELLDTKQRVLLFASSAAVMAGVTMVLKRTYDLVNGVHRDGQGRAPTNSDAMDGENKKRS